MTREDWSGGGTAGVALADIDTTRLSERPVRMLATLFTMDLL